MINPKTKCVHSINFNVAKNYFQCLFGLSAVVNDDCFMVKVVSHLIIVWTSGSQSFMTCGPLLR